MSSLYLPGRGMVDLAAFRDEAAVHQAVQEYDERLLYATNPQTGLPTVFIKMGPWDNPAFDNDAGIDIDGERVFPVLSFNGTPPADTVVAELAKRDTIRHGSKLLEELHAHNARVKAQYEAEAAEADGIAAEAYESYLHGQDLLNYKRVFRPDPKRSAVKK